MLDLIRDIFLLLLVIAACIAAIGFWVWAISTEPLLGIIALLCTIGLGCIHNWK